MSPSDPFTTPDSTPAPEIDPGGAPEETPQTTPLPDSDPGDRPVDGSVMAAGDSDPA